MRSYREPSSDEDLDQVIARYPDMIVTADTNQNRPRQQALRRSPRKNKKTAATDSPRKRRRVEATHTVSAPVEDGSNRRIPPWHTLPYHILFDIFFRASHPLVDVPQGLPRPSIKWLLGVALLCRSFAEPALAALYHTPVLIPAYRAHKLIELLSQPPGSTLFNYASKIQELWVDVRPVLTTKAGPTYGYVDLTKIIEKTPHIKTLRLFDSHDVHQPLMGLIHPPKWKYPDSLFDCLRNNQVRLHSFDWNARFMDSSSLVDTMLARHREEPFSTLREVKLVQIVSDDDSVDESSPHLLENRLGAALCALPELRRLTFVDCFAVNERLLPKLPPTLHYLNIDSCDDLVSQSLAPFLANQGGELRELVLKHNRHLNMSFAVRLAESCPKLERLSVDFIMHPWPPYYTGAPHFDDLFKPGEVPTWPKSLQEIELLQLRQWDKERAAAFFGSLVDAAPNLKDLRKIVISATVQMGWQDRALFRRQWIKKLERTFLRPDDSPVKNSPDNSDAKKQPETRRHSSRRSARAARKRLTEMDDSDIDSNDADDDANSTTSKAGGAPESDTNGGGYIQGLCHTVAIRIDNLRPTEQQFNENDFLNSEDTDEDEEWDGHDWDWGMDDEVYEYAW